MAPRTSFKTSKGTELPLLNLKGKEYLMVAHRLVWLEEEVESYNINTEMVQLTDTHAVVKTTLTTFDKDGRVARSVTATKKETKADFPDFIEKAETGSLGRALAMAGFGTQFSTQDLDEGNRLADAPLEAPKQHKNTSVLAPVSTTLTPAATATAPLEANSAVKKVSSFRKPPVKKAEVAEEPAWE
jgi:hypothetical protein